MAAHKFDKIIFASEATILVKALNNLYRWPNFWYHVSEMKRFLSAFEGWRMVFESRLANNGAFLIARSVTREYLWQSYVTRGHPHWLDDLFALERNYIGLVLFRLWLSGFM